MEQTTIKGSEPPYVPEDIIRNILKRLPVKSLIRFRCVCKDWKNLLKTSSFITDHLRHSNQNSSLIFECVGLCNPYGCGDVHLYLVDREIKIRRFHNVLWDPYANIVGSSNGLLCFRLQSTTNSFLVYNPALVDVRLVPESLSHVDEGFLSENCYVGFGFSAIVNDYKIVRTCSSSFDRLIYRAEVFSLSTGLWKEVEVGSLKGAAFLEVNGITTNGAIFWFCSKPGGAKAGENYHHLIVSFDIAREAFTLIPMPPIHFNYATNFTVYEHKLALLYPTGNYLSCWIELWVMEEEASVERWIWTQKYRSNSYSCWLEPRTIWRNEIVCGVDVTFSTTSGAADGVDKVKMKIVLINLTTNEFNVFTNRRVGGPYLVVFDYVESLVPVNNVPNEEPESLLQLQ